MKRINIEPRTDWKSRLENIGFGFHTSNLPYWDESVYYEFDMSEIDKIEDATNELWGMCIEAVQYVIDNNLFDKFQIPEFIIPHIIKSWNEDHPSIYGRFDFSFKDGCPKMLEFNADTPTSLFESSIVQWYWLQDVNKDMDQFNSIHEKLVDYWNYLKEFLYKDYNDIDNSYSETLYFTVVRNNLEDLTTVEYLRDCAIQAGINTRLIYIDDIGWDESRKLFIDLDDNVIKNVFKLYPWEFIVNEPFAKNIITDINKTFWIEPSWKMILSNKAILPILWQLFPNHDYLLESYFEGDTSKSCDGLTMLGDYVKKPLLSREGANVEIYKKGVLVDSTSGIYNNSPRIIQEFCELPKFGDYNALVGSWIIGQEPAGIGIREGGIITNNISRFVPHLIKM